MKNKKWHCVYWGGILFNLVVLCLNIWWAHDFNKEDINVCFENVTIYECENKNVFAEENSQYYNLEQQFMSMYSYPTDVCFVGDSLTMNCPWNELFPEKNIKNRGIGSDTTNGLLARLDSIIKIKPEKIFLMIGINDFSMGSSVRSTFLNYMKITKILEENLPNCKIYIESCLPVSDSRVQYSSSITELNKLLSDYCEETDYIYVDLWTSFADDNGFLKKEYNIDGVHINAKGYENWKRIIDDML